MQCLHPHNQLASPQLQFLQGYCPAFRSTAKDCPQLLIGKTAWQGCHRCGDEMWRLSIAWRQQYEVSVLWGQFLPFLFWTESLASPRSSLWCDGLDPGYNNAADFAVVFPSATHTFVADGLQARTNLLHSHTNLGKTCLCQSFCIVLLHLQHVDFEGEERTPTAPCQRCSHLHTAWRFACILSMPIMTICWVTCMCTGNATGSAATAFAATDVPCKRV